jgi:hypothetical protein
MTENDQKEEISRAYVKAVAATAGFSVYQPSIDDDSIDMGISSGGSAGMERRPRVELQLKCTAAETPEEDKISFPLKLKNYDDLRIESSVPRILVVMLVPAMVSDWLTHSEAELVVRRCAYWVSLFGMPESQNALTVTVAVPRENLFSVNGLRGIMSRINDRGKP